MKIVSNIVRAAVFAAFAFGASALAPTSGNEAQAQSGYSHAGHRAHHARVKPRPVYRHRHVAPRRVYHSGARYYAPRVRPVYVAPRRCVVRSRWVNTYYGPRLVKQRVCYRRW
ncbi:MAG: hypothetical protein ACK4MV_15675 [Beijerinckiaceae bacterium]